MIPFLVIKTRAGFSYVRPDHVIAVNSTEPGECIVLLTHGVTIAAAEPAEDVVARLEDDAREADQAQHIRESRNHGHEAR